MNKIIKMDQCSYDHQISDAIINIDYNTVKNLITLYPINAQKYYHTCVGDIIYYRDKSVYKEKWSIMIDMLKILFEYETTAGFNEINYILLKWAVDTSNLEIVKYVISLYKKFNIQPLVGELLNDESDEFFDITDEILHYLAKRYDVMKINKYYSYFDNMPYKRLANMGVEPIEIILI
jgi:hypothetical protein